MAALLTSCFETDQDITLNPDGSGKVVHESKFHPFAFNIGGGQQQTEDEKMQQAVADIITKSKGVDVWDDVHFERLDDGRIHFRGTAWFPDISKLKIENQMMLEFGWERDPSGNGGLSLAIRNDGVEDSDENAPPDDEEGRRAWLAAERGKFQQARMMMSTMLTGMRHTARFQLPGESGETHGFEDAGDGWLSINFDGARFLDGLDKQMADDAWLLEHGFSEAGDSGIPPALLEVVFGGEESPMANRTALDGPLFDYDAEVAAARANADALAEKIGGSAGTRVLPPSEGGPLKSVQVIGARFGLPIDPELEMRFHNHHEGVAVTVLCEFDGAILSIDSQKSIVETAVTGDGSSLLPRRDFDRRLHSLNLSEKKTHAIFEVRLDAPPSGADRLRDLAGAIHYSVAGDTKEIDLGITKLEKGERGEELGSEITEIKPGWRDDGPLDLSLRLNIGRDELVNAWIVRGASRQLLERRGHSSSNNITTFTFELEKDYEPEARIVVEVHDEIRNFTTPFILRDIALPVVDAP